MVAHVSEPDFDGVITYDAEDDGNQVGALGSVEVFATGLRNSYDFTFHSNGRLYATDNGPNEGYGDMSTGCTESIPDVQEEDKLNLIVQGGYYGFPNRKRGDIDARQCVWRSAHEASDADYTAPLAILPASSNGIVEFESDAFEGQLRGDLIGKLSSCARCTLLVFQISHISATISLWSAHILFIDCWQWGNTRMNCTESF